MAYRIIYEPEGKRRDESSAGTRLMLTISFFLCFLWLVDSYWPEGREMLRQLLIPGDAALQAAEVFAQELQSGFSFPSAAENFCRSVMGAGCAG